MIDFGGSVGALFIGSSLFLFFTWLSRGLHSHVIGIIALRRLHREALFETLDLLKFFLIVQDDISTMVLQKVSEEGDLFGIYFVEISYSIFGGLVACGRVIFIEIELDDGVGAAGKH